MKKKLLPIALLCMLGIGVLAGCGHKEEPKPDDPPVQEDVHVTGVSLNKETLSLGVGRDETLVATVAPADATDKSVTWSSADAKVATVADGKVTAVGVGETDISVVTNDGKYSAKCRVSVVLENVQITITNADQLASGLNAGGNMPIELSITPAVNINEYLNKGYLKIESSDTSVISISGTKAYGLKAGTAKITVSLFDGKAEVTCNVLAELPEPAEQKVTVSELIAAWDSDKLGTQLYVIENVYIVSWNTGKTDATKYGNFFVADSLEENAESILVYGATASTQIAQEEGEPLPVISWNGGSGTYAFQNPADFLTNETTKDILLKCKVSLKVFSLEYNGKKELNGIITAVDHSTEDHTTYPEPELVTGKTLAEFFADTQGNGKQLYEVTGIVSAWKEGASDGTQYGNFYLKMNETDEASYYIYGATATASALAWNENSGAYGFTNPKDFLTNELTKDIHLGDTVTMKVTRCDYNGTLEGNGIITAVQAAQHEEIPEPAVEEKTLAEFIALENKANKSYKVAATVKAFKSEAADQFGNMTLTDGEHDLVIYGATATATALTWNKVDGVYGFKNPRDFLTNELTSTIVVGAQITMQLIRADYQGTVQGQGIVLTVSIPVDGDAIPFGEEYSWNPETSQSDIPGSVLTDPDKYYYWNDQNWCGSNVTMNKAVNLLGTLTFDYSGTGNCDFGFQLFYKNTTLTVGQKYTLSLKVTAKNAVTVKLAGDAEKSFDLAAGEETLISKVYTESARASLNLLAPINGETANVLTIKEVKWEEYEEADMTLDKVVFNLGENGEAKHSDGSGAEKYEEVVSGHKLVVSDGVKLFVGARDATGKSAFKLGTGSANASFKVAVPEYVKKVVFNVAGYKAAAAVVQLNGGDEITVSTLSNDGAYTALEAAPVDGFVTFATVTGDGKRAMIDSIEFIINEEETPAEEVNLELANFAGVPVFQLGENTANGFIMLALGNEKASFELYVADGSEYNSKALYDYSFDKATGALTIALGGAFGNFTGTFDEENHAFINCTFDGQGAALLTNNGTLQLAKPELSWSLEGTADELNAVFARRVRHNDAWQLDLTDIAVDSTNVAVGQVSLAREGSTTDQVGLTLRNPLSEKKNCKGIAFWVYNPSDADIVLRTWTFDNTTYASGSEIGNMTAKKGQWTFCRMGFSARNIQNFNICDWNKTGVTLVFDQICLY